MVNAHHLPFPIYHSQLIMKFLLGMLAFAALAIISHFLFPWWGFVLMAMIIGFALPMHAGLAFVCGFATMAMVWGVHAWWIDSANAGILSAKMGTLLKFGSGGTVWWITLLLGGFLGGLGMMTGKLGRDMFLGATEKARYRSRYK